MNTLDELRVSGKTKLTGPLELGTPLQRSYLLQDDEAVYPIPLADFFVWDSGQPLPAAASADDLALIPGTFGTSTPTISSGDCKNATTTRYARAVVTLPPEYVAGQTIIVRIAAGMLTTVASSTCTVGCEAYLVGRNSLVSGSDLCATVAQTINSLTFAEKEFTITPTGLAAGDQLDLRITIACVDSATGTAVKPTLASVDLVCDIKG